MWNDEMIMQFYSTAHFKSDCRIVWMTEGNMYKLTVEEWATTRGAPKALEHDFDVYTKPEMNQNSMDDMYNPVPQKYPRTHKLGFVYFLQPGIPTTNTIMRYTLMPKVGDGKIIKGYSIHMLHHIDTHTRIWVMDLIEETIGRIVVDQNISYGYAPYIQIMINSKIGKNLYLLHCPHLPLQLEFEDNEVVIDTSHPSSATSHVQTKAVAEVEAPIAAPAP